MLCTLIGAIILSIIIQVGLNMHRDASSSLRGSTSSLEKWILLLEINILFVLLCIVCEFLDLKLILLKINISQKIWTQVHFLIKNFYFIKLMLVKNLNMISDNYVVKCDES